MKSTKSILQLIIVIFLISCSSVFAASPQDVKKVLRAVKSDRSKLLSYKEYPEHNGAFEGVYVVNGKRYTAFYSGNERALFSFWVRPDGTSGQKFLETFTDHGLNGKVEFGIKSDKDNPDRKFFDIYSRDVGREHQEYWQSQYDTAIADALEHFDLK